MVYVISKLFTYLVLPPGIFIILLLIASFYMKKFRGIFLFCVLCFYLLSNTVVANLLLYPLENPYDKVLERDKKADAVVVLGGGNIVGSENLPLSGDAYKRAVYGLMIAKSRNLPLVFSGGGLQKQKSESDSFKESMREMGKDLSLDIVFSKEIQRGEFVLVVEDRSLDTFQNAKFTKDKFDSIDFNNPTIYLVTSAYHMRRSIKLYRYFGFKIIPAATDFKISKKKIDAWDYFPQMKAFFDSYLALHEYVGLLSLKLRGI